MFCRICEGVSSDTIGFVELLDFFWICRSSAKLQNASFDGAHAWALAGGDGGEAPEDGIGACGSGMMVGKERRKGKNEETAQIDLYKSNEEAAHMSSLAVVAHCELTFHIYIRWQHAVWHQIFNV